MGAWSNYDSGIAEVLVHPFIPDISIAPLFKPTTTQRRSRHSTDTTSNREWRLAQGPYVPARVGFEPATFRTQGAKQGATMPRIIKTAEV